MKRILCQFLVLVMMCSLCVQAFADGDVLYCRMCGEQIPTDSRVCPYCGEKVVHVTETASDPAPADKKTGSSLLTDIAAAIPPLPAPSAVPEVQETTAPAAAAPAIFSGKPPVEPVSLVTKYLQSNCLKRAALISAENGPCIQMIWEGLSPRPLAFSTESASGRNLA